LAQLVARLGARGFNTEELIMGVPQSWKLTGAIKDAEVRLADGAFHHADQPLMDWCVSNARLERHGNAVLITKQASGVGKIDPLSALFDAVVVLSENPVAGRAHFETHGLLVLA
jgi:phage terminase large subunit-like protein